MHRVRDLAVRCGRGKVNVLIQGESGVGKCFLARMIHKLSERTGSFALVDCGDPEDLLEGRLFGARGGIAAAAAQGTLFLAEIASLPIRLQARLLRTLQTRALVPLGETLPRPTDFRLISSTSQDLMGMVGAGSFRPDLCFRLDGVSLKVPPLRQRRDEIPGLARMFARDLSDDRERRLPTIGAHAMDQLLRYPWPGNVSELKAVIRRAVLLCDSGEISPRHLTVEIGDVLGGLAAGQMWIREDLDWEDVSSGPDGGPRALAKAALAVQEQALLDALTRVSDRPGKRGDDLSSLVTPTGDFACSFCGEARRQVSHLFTGPKVFICDRCVGDAHHVISKGKPRARAESTMVGVADGPDGQHQPGCSFCNKATHETRHLVEGGEVRICDECLYLCDEILAERSVTVDCLSLERHRTISFRANYSPRGVNRGISRARGQLGEGGLCAIVVLVEEGQAEAARRLLARVKLALTNVAEFRELAVPPPGDALVTIARPINPRPA